MAPDTSAARGAAVGPVAPFAPGGARLDVAGGSFLVAALTAALSGNSVDAQPETGHLAAQARLAAVAEGTPFGPVSAVLLVVCD